MPYKDPKDARKYDREYYWKNRDRERAGFRRYYEKHRDRLVRSQAAWREENRGYAGEWYRKRRLLAIETLGGKCVYCGISDSRVLTFNHINGGGRNEYLSKARNTILTEIIQQKRSDLELACFNCNIIHARENGLYIGAPKTPSKYG